MKPVDKTWKIESKKNFWKYWFNKHPDLVITKVIAAVLLGVLVYKTRDREQNMPFSYRYRYTIWRDDDPRAIKMTERMRDFQPLRRFD